MKPIRLGVIGLGLIWMRIHQSVLKTLSHIFEPVALCDLSPERRAAAARDFPNATILNDYRDLLARPEVEAVLVLTPIALNAAVALAALEMGKDVIMEKPLARSVVEGAQLLAAAERQGRRLYVAEQMAYRRADEALTELINGDEIGELLLWDRVFHLEPDPGQGTMRYESTPWRKNPDYPLGPLFDGGVHLIATLTRQFGPPQVVLAQGHQLRAEYGPYDQVSMTFHYQSGLVGTLSHSTYLPPLQNHFHIYGSAGVLTVETERILIDKPGQAQRVVELPAENAYQSMWQALADAFAAGSTPVYTPQRALQEVAILEAVDQSIKTGGIVAIRQ